MQYLVVFHKTNRKLIATFKLNTIITEMEVLSMPDVGYLLTCKKDILYTAPNGEVFVKED
ncbi:hypothetical protein [Bacillus sp. AFS002410]|uniref:hypothetical protein n=1 Tax=Bacillus sp. AFS002410 TaxID=2033481 RepID=UPI0011552D2C|nr:hypothetical protein [Bacillus sp. AFS002410]